ncbi:hypothetical protein ACWOCB_01350 [Gemella haemolysans]|uniref:Uncharacterized protein n=1 Tax=Gemella haemolysans ATCC 10379 TaxID=546270 RepID=C5NUH1_9BACL|nr:hypothetical protein [Gemella haemolysans]EER69172.1 hypothetical protein GEMHA0001_0073 [Gemella haemolysans ATCC 10379]KAA8708688.1 hypothetical protein F4V11_01690 [Gemella haemolysans]UBH82619.1 hypothetical protein LA340_01310 [Gemella haemolysans]VEI39126.1 Uncharacterised protein [Gemella haemolysans]
MKKISKVATASVLLFTLANPLAVFAENRVGNVSEASSNKTTQDLTISSEEINGDIVFHVTAVRDTYEAILYAKINGKNYTYNLGNLKKGQVSKIVQPGASINNNSASITKESKKEKSLPNTSVVRELVEKSISYSNELNGNEIEAKVVYKVYELVEKNPTLNEGTKYVPESKVKEGAIVKPEVLVKPEYKEVLGGAIVEPAVQPELPKAEEPATPAPKAEEIGVPAPKAEEPSAPAPKAEQPSAPAPKAEEPAAPAPKAEEPAAPAPKAEEPAASAPKAEGPAAPAPKAEEPAAPAPKAEEPAASAPKVEEPAAPAPKVEEPATPAPKAEEPATPAPKAEEPAAPAPKAEEPATPAPKAEEIGVPAPKAEEPAAPAPKAEEPAAPAPKVEEPATPAPKAEEPAAPAPKAEEPATPAPKVEEPAAPSPKAEEPAAPSPKAEEPAAPALKVEEPAAPAPKAEEPAAPSPKAEEPAAPALKVEEPAAPAPKAEEPTAPKEDTPSEEVTPKDEKLEEAKKDGKDVIEKIAASKLSEIEKVKDEAEKAKLEAKLKELKEAGLEAINNAKDHDAAVDAADEYQTKIDEINVPGEELPAPNYNKDNLTNGRNEGTTIDNGSTAIGHGSGEATPTPTQPTTERSTTSTAPTQPASTSEGTSSFRNAPEVQVRTKKVVKRDLSNKTKQINIYYNLTALKDIAGALGESGGENMLTFPGNISKEDLKRAIEEKTKAQIEKLKKQGFKVVSTTDLDQIVEGGDSYDYVVEFTKESKSTSANNTGFRKAPLVQNRAKRSAEQKETVDVNVYFNLKTLPGIAGALDVDGDTTIKLPKDATVEQVKAAIQTKIAKVEKRGYKVSDFYFGAKTERGYDYVVEFTKEAKTQSAGNSGFRKAPATQRRAKRSAEVQETVDVNIYFNLKTLPGIAGALDVDGDTTIKLPKNATVEQVKAAIQTKIAKVEKRGYKVSDFYFGAKTERGYDFVVEFKK